MVVHVIYVSEQIHIACPRMKAYLHDRSERGIRVGIRVGHNKTLFTLIHLRKMNYFAGIFKLNLSVCRKSGAAFEAPSVRSSALCAANRINVTVQLSLA